MFFPRPGRQSLSMEIRIAIAIGMGCDAKFKIEDKNLAQEILGEVRRFRCSAVLDSDSYSFVNHGTTPRNRELVRHRAIA